MVLFFSSLQDLLSLVSTFSYWGRKGERVRRGGRRHVERS
jgi:hypothetical protein